MRGVSRFRVWPLLVALIFASVLAVWFAAFRSTDRVEKQDIGHSVNSVPRNWQSELVQKALVSKDRGGERPPFAVLRGIPEPVSKIVRQTAQKTLGMGQSQLGLQFDEAQYLHTALGVGIWIVRGRGVTCILHEFGVLAACNTSRLVARKGLILVGGHAMEDAPAHSLPISFLTLGIAPDWVSRVRLSTAGGGFQTVRVSNNTFAVRTNAPVSIKKLLH